MRFILVGSHQSSKVQDDQCLFAEKCWFTKNKNTTSVMRDY